jgi:hypothetical protein
MAVAVAAFAVVVAGGLLIGQLTPASEPAATTVPPATTVPTSGSSPTSSVFVPPTSSADGKTYVSLTLLDGSQVSLAYPDDLDLTGQGVEVQTVGSLGGSASRLIQAHYESPESFIDRIEEESGSARLVNTFDGADGRPVELWAFENDPIEYLVYDFSPWTVAVWDGRGESMGVESQAAWAANLRGDVYPPGFLVLSANPPLELVPAEAAPGPDGPDIRIDGESGGLLIFPDDCDRIQRLDEEAYGQEVFAFCDQESNTLFFATGSAETQQRIHENLEVDPAPPGVSNEQPPTLDQATGSRVILTNDIDMAVVDVDSQRVSVEPLAELAPGDPLYRLVRRGDSVVFYGETELGPGLFAAALETPTEPRLITDDAWFFVPSAAAERVWVASLDESSPETVRALEAVREMTVDGVITSGPVQPPDGRWPVAAVEDGLVFQGDDILEIWDPDSEEFVGTLPGPFPIATWGNRLVTCTQCDQVVLVNLDADTRRTVELPVGVASVDGYGGSFSPDGRLVAVPALLSPGPITSETEVATVLIDFEAGTTSIIPGSLTVNRTSLQHVAWNQDGDWLFIGPVYGAQGKGHVLAYQPGADTAYRIPAVLEGEYYAMVAE